MKDLYKKSSSKRTIKFTPPAHRTTKSLNWIPPKSKASTVQPKTNIPANDTYFYPLYTGWSFPEHVPVFRQPTQAACWSISRFHKDGLANIWGPNNYPDFLHYVGTLILHPSNIAPIPMPSCSGRTSKVEVSFFSGVQFFQVLDNNAVVESHYARLNESIFNQCIASFKPTPDYHSSSNSIYKFRCVTSELDAVSLASLQPSVASICLDRTLRMSTPFIRLESRFHYIKNGHYCDYGKFAILIGIFSLHSRPLSQRLLSHQFYDTQIN